MSIRHETIHPADYAIFGASLVVSLGIGLYHAFAGGVKRTTSAYMIGNRKLRTLPVAMSLVVSYESSILMMGVPAEIYFYGIHSFLRVIFYIVAAIASAYIYIPMLYDLKCKSIYEYLERRFKSRAVRLFGNILNMIVNLTYLGIVLVGPSLALKQVTGFPDYVTVIALMVIAVAYTSLGGIKSVVWTDVFQATVMIAAMVAVIIKGTYDTGGVAEVIHRNHDNERFHINFSFDPRIRLTFWIALLGPVPRFFTYGFNQTSFQRICSTPSQKAARRVMLMSIAGFVLFDVLAHVQGFVSYAYYDTVGCDPLASKQISNPNQLIILLVRDLFERIPGIYGLFMAALFSAALRNNYFTESQELVEAQTTLSSILGSVSTNFYEDIVKPHYPKQSEAKATLIAKIAVVVGGIASVIVALLISRIGGTLVEITFVILGAIGAPVTGIMLVALLFPCCEKKGVFVGGIVSFLITCWASFGKSFSTNLPKAPTLPPAPMDNCPGNISLTLKYGIYYSNTNVHNASFESFTSNHMAGSSTTAMPSDPTSLGLDAMYSLSPFLYNSLGITLCVIVAIVVSLLFGGKHETEERYITPVIRKMWRNSGYLSPVTKLDDGSAELPINQMELEIVSPKDSEIKRELLNDTDVTEGVAIISPFPNFKEKLSNHIEDVNS